MNYRPIVSLDGWDFRVICPTPELHEKVRQIPGAVELRAQGAWRIPATVFVGDRIQTVLHPVEMHTSFREYMSPRLHALADAQRELACVTWPEIPDTDVQPTGKWMHQRKAFWFAERLEACMLNITMGGGKTKIACDLIRHWQSDFTLIISPLAAIDDAWSPALRNVLQKHMALLRTDYERLSDFVFRLNHYAPPRAVVVNWEAFWREPFRSWAADQEWDLIIADEVHRAKSAGSFSSKFLYQLGLRAHRRLGLTGTLMPHSPLDIYGQFRFLDAGIFGTNVASFREEFAVMGGYHDKEVIGFKNLSLLKEKIAAITVTIDDSEQGLPEVSSLEHKVVLEPKARKVYDAMDKEFVASVKSGDITAANAGVKLLRLHQIASGIAKLEDGSEIRISTSKIAGLLDVIGDIPEDDPVVIFVRFKRDLHDILAKISRFKCCLLGDGLNELQDWKRGKRRFLVAQIQAAKEGIDLTRAAYAVFYSTGLSLGDYEQCQKRLHRPPQKRMVRFIHILARATKDVDTMRALKKRKSVIEECLRSARA